MFGRSNKGNYAYTATRAKAKKAHLLREEDYNKLLQMTSTSEIARYISDSGYSKEMLELADKVGGVDLVERATYLCMAREFSSLLVGAQGELKSLLSAYLGKWDAWNLKVILRGRSYGLSNDQIKSDLVPAGSLGAEELDKLIAYESSEDVINAYCRMTFTEIPADVMSDFKTTGNIGKVEDYIDINRFGRLIRSVNSTSAASRIFVGYIRDVIDMKNIETILKLKVEGVPSDKVMEYVIPNGKSIDEKFAKQLADEETLAAAIADLSQFEIYDYIKEIADSGNITVRDIMIQTRKYEMDNMKKFASEYPLSALPVVDYMAHKEVEAGNIRTIARGLESGLDKSDIKELLVI